MEKVKPQIWNTSPACDMTFKELVKIINELIDKVNNTESNNKKLQSRIKRLEVKLSIKNDEEVKPYDLNQFRKRK